jgi:hypothetical protein
MDGVDDFFPVGLAGLNVARRNPAADAASLQPGANRVGDGLVFGGIADENVVRQDGSTPGIMQRIVAFTS